MKMALGQVGQVTHLRSKYGRATLNQKSFNELNLDYETFLSHNRWYALNTYFKDMMFYTISH